jgi:cytochrome c peroxidase
MATFSVVRVAIRAGLSIAVLSLISLIRWAPPAASAQTPNLPLIPYDYVAYAVTNLPDHYLPTPPFGDAGAADNTPADNPITNHGATLGRVLFYDTRLSRNFSISCGSCHTQDTGFGDIRQHSVGATGQLTFRHSMGLSNAKFYLSGRFRWDVSAPTLEHQCLIPIQAADEMGMPLPLLRQRLSFVPFYRTLFTNAFGDPQITDERIAKALAQFVRSMVSYNSKFDSAFEAGENGYPDFEAVFNESELLGQQLFQTGADFSLRCDRCHLSPAFISDVPRNIGLNLDDSADPGAGEGRFKSISLRNIDVRGRFMHDGRFTTLEEVVEFYNSGIQDNPNLDLLLRENGDPNGEVVRLNLTEIESRALVDFMKTLTDHQFLADEKFSDPFRIMTVQPR